jgi:prepilin-type N-terminal cleavage/methylation domain-containing protein
MTSRASQRFPKHGNPPLRGFTLIEVMVVVAIIFILISLMLPAVQGARESARRMQCKQHLMNLGLALQNYHGAHRALPPGTIDRSGPIVSSQKQGYRISWVAQILPYIDEGNVQRKIDFKRSAYEKQNAAVGTHYIPLLACPSNPRPRSVCYAGVHHDVEAPIDADNHGVLFLNSRVRLPEDVPDGSGYTIFVGEMEGAPTWLVGDNQTLRNTGTNPSAASSTGMAAYTQPVDPEPGNEAADDPQKAPSNIVGGFNSNHTGGCNILLGDGNIRFISTHIDADLFRRLGHRNDGSLVGAF